MEQWFLWSLSKWSWIFYHAVFDWKLKLMERVSWLDRSSIGGQSEVMSLHIWYFTPKSWLVKVLKKNVFVLFYIPTSPSPCSQPAGPEYARWSSCDIQQTQSTSQHSLSSSTHSNLQAHGQAVLHPRRLHLPGKTPGRPWHLLSGGPRLTNVNN